MLEWEDTTSYSRGDMQRIPRVLRLTVQDIDIIIHRHIHYKDTWFLSCYMLDTENKDIRTNDLEEAKKLGLQYVFECLNRLCNCRAIIESLINDANVTKS